MEMEQALKLIRRVVPLGLQRLSPPVLEITTLFMSIHPRQPLSYLVIENIDGVLHLIKTVHGSLLLRQKKKVFPHLLPVETTTLFLSVL
jgi:hypothetical protein